MFSLSLLVVFLERANIIQLHLSTSVSVVFKLQRNTLHYYCYYLEEFRKSFSEKNVTNYANINATSFNSNKCLVYEKQTFFL